MINTTINSSFRVILASSSPYRKELLERLRIPFRTKSPDIDESPNPNEDPLDLARRLAISKAQVISTEFPNSIVIGSDQVACVGNVIIGKPGNHDKALKQLQLMRGQVTLFHTALCVIDNRPNALLDTQVDTITTEVEIRNLSDQEFDRYLKIEQPYDCAGSAKNEGLGVSIIGRMTSNDPTALTGLPLISLCTMLRNLNISPIGLP